MSDELIHVRPWPDPIIDTLGHDPRSAYVEAFYLPTLGPTAYVLLRHLAGVFERVGVDMAGREDAEATVIELSLAETAQCIGLGPRGGEGSPILRTFDRLRQFDFAIKGPDGTYAVRRSVPPVSRRYIHRLPDPVRIRLSRWMEQAESPRQMAVERARRTALMLVEQGASVDMAEHTLLRLGFLPVAARNAASWARDAHQAMNQGVPRSDEAA